MLTPLLKPSRLTSMNFSAGPWNQVAFIQPSGCQTVLKRSQSPESRQITQFSTVSRISSFSATSGSMAGQHTADVSFCKCSLSRRASRDCIAEGCEHKVSIRTRRQIEYHLRDEFDSIAATRKSRIIPKIAA